MMTENSSRNVLLVAALAAALAGCSSEKKEADCVPAVGGDAAGKAKIVSTPLFVDPQAGKKNNDWCRACVMGTKGYASCQRVFGDTPDEPRDKIRERARIKACVDSGYTETNCPAGAIIGQSCKGDPPPPGSMDPGAALQNLYQKLNPDGVVQPKKPAEAKPAAPTDASGKPKIITVD
jgi:hypothetical protein